MPLASQKCEKEALWQLCSQNSAVAVQLLCGRYNRKLYKLIFPGERMVVDDKTLQDYS